MSTYTVSVLNAIARIALWLMILFVLLPQKLFPAESSGGHGQETCLPWTRRVFDHVVRMAFASILIVHVLAFLHLYDVFSLVAAYVAIHAGYLTWVLGVAPREVLRGIWRRLVALSLNVLDARIYLSRVLSVRLADVWQRLAGSLPRGIDLLWASVLAVVLVASGYLRLQDAVRHPAPTPPDYYLHLLWVKGLGINRLYPDGVYPFGSHALFQILRQFTVVDEALLLRVAPGLAGTLLVVTIYWTVVRLTDHRGPAIIAAALYGVFAFAGWLPLRLDLQGDVLAVEVALIFLLPTFVFLTEAIVGGNAGAEEQGSRGAGERRSGGAEEQGSRGAGERRSRGAEEQRSRGEFTSSPLHPSTSAPQHLCTPAPLPPVTSAPLLFFQAMTCVFLIHPFVGLLALVGLAGALLASPVLDRRADVGLLRLAGMGLAAALLGVLPLLLGLALGKGVHLGPLRWDVHFLGARLREGRFLPQPPSAPEPTLLLSLTTAGALLLLLLPGRWEQTSRRGRTARYVFATFLLILAMLFQPARFNLPEFLLPAQVARVLVLVLCAVVGLVLHQVWAFLRSISRLVSWSDHLTTRPRDHLTKRPSDQSTNRPTGGLAGLNAEGLEVGLTTAVLTALFIAAPPLSLPVPVRREYDVVAEQLYRIKREMPAYKWTIVGYTEALPQVFGRGFFVDNEAFLERYRPETWRFDPRRPELAVPTPHVFIFVEKRPFVVPGTTAEAAARRDRIRRRLQAWVERYQASHDDMSVYYEDVKLAIYHTYRPPEVEERILEAIERQKRE